ncbi:hypothetical protein RvY_15411 [Ramazzottius varieornatus]|uniref:SAM domain-containing protein n=1 Tax=Ramazzottius varieornatus TaxID=947166 RepID=A0A1D1VZI0_RAMVA|nr:hypothetical protein RvY_15411 [Ramazzottius varieornatus]
MLPSAGILRRGTASPLRPLEPPPYPGRSVIVNYDLDDPLHWKNKMDKLKVAPSQRPKAQQQGRLGQQQIRPKSPSVAVSVHNEGTPPSPAPRPSPVAAGAIVTLSMLKQRELDKRRGKLATSVLPATMNGEQGNQQQTDTGRSMDDYNSDTDDSEEEHVDSAEESLALKLRKLIGKEKLNLDDMKEEDQTSAEAVYNKSGELGDNAHQTSSSTAHHGEEVSLNPSGPPPSAERSEPSPSGSPMAPPKPPRTIERKAGKPVVDDSSKFHVYGLPSLPPRPSSGRRNADIPSTSVSSSRGSRARHSIAFAAASPAQPTVSPRSGQARNLMPRSGHYTSVNTPPVPPDSPENSHSSCASSSPTDHATIERHFWESSPVVEKSQRRNAWLFPQRQYGQQHYGGGHGHGQEAISDGEGDSTGAEQRTCSSDEGFCGNIDDERNSDDFTRKQVLLMCDMQMQLLKSLHNKEKRQRQPAFHMNDYSQRRSRSSSHSEAEMQMRCEMLEGHIASLSQNIAQLTEELQYQQATMRYHQKDPAPRVRFVEDVESERAVPSIDPYSDFFPKSPRMKPCRVPRSPSVPEVDLRSNYEPEQKMFSKPERITKLTKFFGTEPPLVPLFLKRLGYEKYARLFELEKIGMNELPYMTEDRLARLGIPMGPRIRIIREAQKAMNVEL